MARLTQDEVSQIITGVIQGRGPKGIAARMKKPQSSVTNAILKLQRHKPLFQRILDGESVDMIAQDYVDRVAESRKASAAAAAKARIEKRGVGQLSRIEAKLDELLALYKSASNESYDAQGKRRPIFG